MSNGQWKADRHCLIESYNSIINEENSRLTAGKAALGVVKGGIIAIAAIFTGSAIKGVWDINGFIQNSSKAMAALAILAAGVMGLNLAQDAYHALKRSIALASPGEDPDRVISRIQDDPGETEILARKLYALWEDPDVDPAVKQELGEMLADIGHKIPA